MKPKSFRSNILFSISVPAILLFLFTVALHGTPTTARAKEATLKLFDGHLHPISDDEQRYPRVQQTGPPPGDASGRGGLPAGVGGQSDTPRAKTDIDKRVIKWMDEEGVEAAAAVQKKGTYGTDNSYTIDASDAHKDRLCAVVILDAQDEKTPDRLRDMIKNHGVGGLRLTGPPAADGTFPWLSSPQALKAWSVANDAGISMDIMITNHDNSLQGVPEIIKLAKAYPKVRLVLNHVLYPKTEGGPEYGINAAYAEMANLKNIYYKFTVINLDILQVAKLSAPDFVRRIVDVYGADHVLWGSDAGNSSGSYKEIVGRIIAATEKLTDEEKKAVLYATGKSVYKRGGKKGFALSTDQLLARTAIEALCVEYFYLLDHGQAIQLADLFSENGVQDFGEDRRLVGRDAIREHYAKRSKTRITRHVTTNLRLVFESENRVRGLRTFTHYAGTGDLPPAIPSVAEYEEIFERGSDGIWRFAYRKPISVFSKKE